MICSKCGQEVKSKQELEGLKAKDKISLYVSSQRLGTYPAQAARETGISRSTASFYLDKLALEKEIYKVNIGSWMKSKDMYLPYLMVKGLADYPNWSFEQGEGIFKSVLRFSIVQKQDSSKYLRIQQKINLNGLDQGIGGICVPLNAMIHFIDMLAKANVNM